MARELPPRRGHLLLLALGWTFFVTYGSLVPLRFRDVSLADALEQFRHLPPPWFGIGARADLGVNVLLFIPLTFLWMGALVSDRGRVARLLAAVVLVPAAAMAAVAVEFSQLWFTGRTTSQNDIVAESIGGLVGVLLWLGAGRPFVAWWRTFAGDRRPRSRLTWVLEAYLLGLLIYSVAPLDLTLSVTDLYHKYERGQVLLVPFHYHYSSLSTVAYQFFADVVEFVPAGAWAVLRYRHLARHRSPLWVGAVGGGLIAAVIELLQLLVLSRYTDVTDIVLGTIGAGIGGWLVGRHEQRPIDGRVAGRVSARRASVQWLAAVALYTLFLAAGFWFPFAVTHDREVIVSRWNGFFRLPFVSLYLSNEFNALTQMLIRVLLFAPLGAMWAYLTSLARIRGLRHAVTLFGLAYCATVAFGIEAVQVVMPEKVADATEVLLCFAGAAGGLFISRRVLQARGDS